MGAGLSGGGVIEDSLAAEEGERKQFFFEKKNQKTFIR
jgi:hypothetical protein